MHARVPVAKEEDGTNALLPRNSAIAISFVLLYEYSLPSVRFSFEIVHFVSSVVRSMAGNLFVSRYLFVSK
jgi:hypothetical protein